MNIDALIIEADKVLRTLFASQTSIRPHPDQGLPEANLSETERRHVAGLMRVNHSGEVCAQALYQGQALTSRDPAVRDALREAAHEEIEHLAWTEQRLRELGSHTSWLNPLWYAGSLTMGVLAGKLGDRWNLGFLAETEKQVTAHLESHLARLPESDIKSAAIIGQMAIDETSHAHTAEALGAAQLPPVAKQLMQQTAKVMTALSYRI
ncbi:MAG: 2-polyprenyl-3-methyl-6-methoxy-1,4-benzoquinone monooxygenase [Rhodocyclaceae bacterium]|jgi:ubiquinone biosynthesis monooxygenase Coq7|uniref:2-polyprenyl-3-methyl-6-methoxy-1,4-benzoquinone monooxygenase n=1 Tax=Fluviibacter phosphoraccumulans TaxID=1751046 RepID=UPI0010B73881|nr:2-polyprenyl-3-methyl-6-methoxy-1,4-benzoquinone monooxygenase [Fluviibacter phosphoraccumulans]MBP7918212.1 2-polyprenyl-3-methyl-6-methoxy-1,4-benzoquinone monooxygenase [Rhodocyclaceae bacterium]MBP7991331.1 2-polyprenyl-3-methyl-6-methoxy-1,4-benzoquinone monooxygenase [Rhodocyclaceae bacterium]BCA64570.1 2-nonaprenyl-3-methyl-6-methoxy-1,4-benzoquinol hydroxylase [Fluviibacter phosphoraccumulans]